MQKESKKLNTEKKIFEQDASELAYEQNKLKDEVRLKTEAFNTLNIAMEQLKADREKDIVAAKKAAKADLMKDYWVHVTKAYQIGFHDGAKRDPCDRYFENLEECDARANTSSVLPPFSEALE